MKSVITRNVENENIIPYALYIYYNYTFKLKVHIHGYIFIFNLKKKL